MAYLKTDKSTFVLVDGIEYVMSILSRVSWNRNETNKYSF